MTAKSASAINSGHFQIIIGPNVGALAAGRNLGRFADLLGSPARALLEHSAQVAKLQAPNALCAELVYLPPRTRTANVTIRPAIHDYEVVLGVTPGVSPERVIPLAELMVGVRGGRFYLHWPRMGKDVVICTSHMLNPRSGLEIARFLSELSTDSRPQLNGFDWGPATGFPFLPRVQAGRIVLHLARRRIDMHLREQWLDTTDFRRFVQSLQLWREHWQVPHQIYLSQNDNRLLLDLEDEHHIKELMKEISNISGDEAVTLQEVLPTLDCVWTEGPAGHYVAEFVVPLKLHHKFTSTMQEEFSQTHLHVQTNEAAKVTASVPTEARLRLPGSEWLFIKLYCPRVLEEDVLVDHMHNFLHQVVRDNVAQEWFFVRYADPDPHLRLRFLGSPTHLQQQLLPQLADLARNLVAKGLCQRFVIDTYEREVERYGGDVSLCEVEKVFAADSQAVIDLLRLIRVSRMQVDRTMLAVLSVDDLLAGLGLNLEERVTWYRKNVQSRQEAGTDYRQRKADLRTLLINPLNVFSKSVGASIMQILEERRTALIPIGLSLRQLAERGELFQDLDQLYGSIIHMHCNRLLGVDRSAERLVLGLLLRTREGLLRSPYC